MERTLVLIKPDAVARALVGRILARFEARGLHLAGLRLLRLDRARAAELYRLHEGRPFYEGLVRFITSGPLVAAAVEGRGAVGVVRAMLGATDAGEAAPGSIRGDFGLSHRFNLVHGSDSAESAAREIPIFFGEDDLVPARQEELRWNYDWSEGAPI